MGELLKSGSITRREAGRMLLFCVNAGPAFVVSTVGAGLLGNARYGVVLLAAHMLASLTIGWPAVFLERRFPAGRSMSARVSVRYDRERRWRSR